MPRYVSHLWLIKMWLLPLYHHTTDNAKLSLAGLLGASRIFTRRKEQIEPFLHAHGQKKRGLIYWITHIFKSDAPKKPGLCSTRSCMTSYTKVCLSHHEQRPVFLGASHADLTVIHLKFRPPLSMGRSTLRKSTDFHWFWVHNRTIFDSGWARI